jgi:uncharacterized C2H2 Zn-finger protein
MQDKIETIKKLLDSVHCVKNIDDAISAVLKKLSFCPFCNEYFTDSGAFQHHMKKEHSDRLATKTVKVETNEVDEDAETIYICPHCHFAVDNFCQSPTSSIIDHIQKHASSIDPTARISFQISSDKELIQTYVKDKVEIKLFRCSVCTDIFGDQESLKRHLHFKHSDVDSKNTPYEVINLIMKCVNDYPTENQKKKKHTPNYSF